MALQAAEVPAVEAATRSDVWTRLVSTEARVDSAEARGGSIEALKRHDNTRTVYKYSLSLIHI